MEFPKNLRYTKDHEWARKDGAKIVVGVSAFAVEQLGDITQVDLPAIGAELKVGATFGTIESVKSVSDLYAPISGKIVEINLELEDNPELINESCYEKGWMVAIAPTGSEYDALMDVGAYGKLVAEEH